MENVLGLTPMQQIFVLAMHAWMFFVFPIMVLKKLNNITSLLESQIYEDEEDEGEGDAFDVGE